MPSAGRRIRTRERKGPPTNIGEPRVRARCLGAAPGRGPRAVARGWRWRRRRRGARRVAFKRNRFVGEGFVRFCEYLERNGAVKEVVLSECGIGAGGAGLVAGALRLNECVEELQIWEDSIGSRGAEDLSKMIEANSTLKKLSIFDSSIATAAPVISAVLARNRTMDVQVWSRESQARMARVVEFTPESGTLRISHLDVSGTCRVACALGMNLTVNTLDLRESG
ncbi:hypothetical protein MLD38_034266 [Melastoma candidum]|uniref:Uncharacterized protein n=1 Tax=Melastoma candidum TaxID=119954 RepID=A0ACB9MD53_9MYRT|nr:hypothetical protein MLD38_034266 [Melastoma candidum]